MVIAQHGTRESPCTFFNVTEREHYSGTLDRHFRHTVLSIGYHFDGPTEIGGLVVHPARRGGEEKPGKQLAYVRFLYMAGHLARFRETVLAELMPPLTPDGRSVFWEAFGRRFTDLDYPTADKKSRENKEFIQQLFPPVDVYATLFPPAVRRVLGKVGPADRAHPKAARPDRLPVRQPDRPLRRRPALRGEAGRGHPGARPPPRPAGRRAALRRGDALAGRAAAARSRNRFRAVRTEAALEGGRVRLPVPAAAAAGRATRRRAPAHPVRVAGRSPGPVTRTPPRSWRSRRSGSGRTVPVRRRPRSSSRSAGNRRSCSSP